MIKAVIFDLDDTLLDHSAAAQRAAVDLYHRTVKDAQVTAEEFHQIWLEELDRYHQKYLDREITFEQQRILRVRGVFQRLGRKVDEGEALDLFRFYLNAYEKRWQLLPDAARCLAGLDGCRLGVISNSDSEQQRKKLKRLGIFNRFDSVVVSGDCGIAKPNPRIFGISLEQLGINAQEALFAGDDYERDFQGAAKAGLHACWVNRVHSQEFETVEDGFVINSLDLLQKVVRCIEARIE